MKNLLKKVTYSPETKTFALHTGATAPFFGKSLNQIAYKVSKTWQGASYPEVITAIKSLEKVWVSAPNGIHWSREKIENFFAKA